jgi:hypothetical protein
MAQRDKKLIDKPPIGICPKHIWESIRLNNLKDAINRYIDANQIVQIEWINEYNDFIKQITAINKSTK